MQRVAGCQAIERLTGHALKLFDHHDNALLGIGVEDVRDDLAVIADQREATIRDAALSGRTRPYYQAHLQDRARAQRTHPPDASKANRQARFPALLARPHDRQLGGRIEQGGIQLKWRALVGRISVLRGWAQELGDRRGSHFGDRAAGTESDDPGDDLEAVAMKEEAIINGHHV